MKFRRILSSVLVFFGIGILLIVDPFKGNEKIDWMDVLNYKSSQIFDISFGFYNPCPLITLRVNDNNIKLVFDTGNGTGLFLTTAVAGNVDYEITGKIRNLNPDGTYRGEGSSILLKKLTVFGKEFSNVKASISDWKMYGSLKINGAIGLAFFQNKVITLDYKNKKIAVTEKPVDYSKIKEQGYVILPLVKSDADNQGDLLYFEGYVNGEKSTIYLDTGSTRSFIDLNGKTDKNRLANVKIGEREYNFSNLKSVEINRGGNFQYPIRLELNSDILKSQDFIITIDKINNKLIIH